MLSSSEQVRDIWTALALIAFLSAFAVLLTAIAT